MSSEQEIEVATENETPVKKVENQANFIPIELPAPQGWKKKLIPRESGTPKRGDVIFVSPTGEEITNKKQLALYLKAHSGGPPSSQFDWTIVESPRRRSARISEKVKATETPENEPLRKRERKSSSKTGANDSDDGDDEAPKENQDDAAGQELKEQKHDEMKEAETEEKNAEEVTAGDGVGSKNETEDSITGSEPKEEKVSEVTPPLSDSVLPVEMEKEVL